MHWRNAIMITVFLINSLTAIQGLNANNQAHRAHVLCKSYGYEVIEAKFEKEMHLLCLRSKTIGSSQLISHRSALLLDPEAEEDGNTLQGFSLEDVTLVYGFPVEDPAAGSAEGYIGIDQQFYGVLHLGNRTLHADPYGRSFDAYSVSFQNDSVPTPVRSRRQYAQLEQLSYFPYQIEGPKRSTGIAPARICDLLLLADKKFFEKDANSSLHHVIRRMMHAVGQADIIFRNTDFNEDGIPDNIGFTVKYILVLISNETNERVFGDLLNQRTVDGRRYLMMFARLRRLSEVCLGVAFSGHAFRNRTLGLSFTSLGGGLGGAAGGMCDRRAFGHSYNTLAIAHATDDAGRLPEGIAALTLAHEMGHSFGAHHDDNFPNPECHGYLMSSQSSMTEQGRRLEFSWCSKRLVAATLSSMSYCLVEEDRPFCGNGIVEEGEACDCGLPTQCNLLDPCCTPRAGGAMILEDGALHRDGCTVAPAASCHPSQGLCCNAHCQYVDLTESGIDCPSQERECTCANMTSECRCGVGGRCLADGSCHAAECAVLGLRECACLKKGPGGAMSRAKKCGICCQLKAKPHEILGQCVGAEIAAQEALAASQLPNDWPDEDYRGPNISLSICKDGICKLTVVRAWPVGSVCVLMNKIGVCSPRGVCKSVSQVPRSNVYPVLEAKLMMSRRNLAERRAANVLILYIFLFSI